MQVSHVVLYLGGAAVEEPALDVRGMKFGRQQQQLQTSLRLTRAVNTQGQTGGFSLTPSECKGHN